MSKYELGLIVIVIALLAAGCSDKKPAESQEQISHRKSIDSCFSLMVQAGAKWHQGDQVGDLCDRENPTPQKRARVEIMVLLAKKGLTPQNVSFPYQLPDGDCQRVAEQFIALHERAFGQDGDAKEKTLAEAASVWAKVNNGSCS